MLRNKWVHTAFCIWLLTACSEGPTAVSAPPIVEGDGIRAAGLAQSSIAVGERRLAREIGSWAAQGRVTAGLLQPQQYSGMREAEVTGSVGAAVLRTAGRRFAGGTARDVMIDDAGREHVFVTEWAAPHGGVVEWVHKVDGRPVLKIEYTWKQVSGVWSLEDMTVNRGTSRSTTLRRTAIERVRTPSVAQTPPAPDAYEGECDGCWREAFEAAKRWAEFALVEVATLEVCSNPATAAGCWIAVDLLVIVELDAIAASYDLYKCLRGREDEEMNNTLELAATCDEPLVNLPPRMHQVIPSVRRGR